MRWVIGLLLAGSSAAFAWNAPDSVPSGSVYFDTDSDKVTGYDFAPIGDQDTVKLVGHADRRWTAAHNLDLSERRAQAVALAIGRPDAAIIAKGDTSPVTNCPTDDAQCLLEDRRVDIYLQCGLTQFACTAAPPLTWGPDFTPARMVTDRSRF